MRHKGRQLAASVEHVDLCTEKIVYKKMVASLFIFFSGLALRRLWYKDGASTVMQPVHGVSAACHGCPMS
jgi:hypothetical protein